MACGIARSTTIVHIHKVVEILAHQYIALPVHTELLMFVKPLNDNSRLHNDVLYIDGFIVKIQRPDRASVDVM